MNKVILIGFCMILVASVVAAAAPTLPTILTTNNSIFFNDPTLTCSGSTDADADDIYYEFLYGWGGTASPGPDYTNEIKLTGLVLSQTDNVALSQGWVIKPLDIVATNQTFYLVNITLHVNSDATRMRIWDNDTNSLEYTKAITPATTTTFSPEIALNYSTPYRIEVDNSGANFDRAYEPGPGIPAVSALVNLSSGSSGQADEDGFLYNIASLTFLDEDPTGGGVGGYVVQNTTSTTCNNYSEYIAGGNAFEWFCRASDINGESSAFTVNRTIFFMNLTNCPSDDTNAALNFTIRDEEDLSLLDNVSFDASLTLSSSVDSLTYGFDLVGSDNYTLCLEPNNVYVNLTGFVEYDTNETGYSYPRQYYFDTAEIIGNAVQNINLYQLADSLATAVTFVVVRGTVAVEDIIIHLQRYNPGTGEYTLVAMAETNSEGKDVIYLRLTDAWYRIFAYEDNTLVYSNDAEHITSTTKTIYLSTGGDAMTDYWTQWEHFENIIYNMSWDNHSQWAAVTFDDATGAASNVCFIVDKILWNSTSNVCYNCTSAASGTLGCKITEDDNQYYARFIVYRNPWRTLDELWIDIRTKTIDIIGQQDGIFYTVLIVGILTFMAIWNPATAIILAVAGTGFMYAFGFFDVAYGFMISLAIAAALLIMRLKT